MSKAFDQEIAWIHFTARPTNPMRVKVSEIIIAIFEVEHPQIKTQFYDGTSPEEIENLRTYNMLFMFTDLDADEGALLAHVGIVNENATRFFKPKKNLIRGFYRAIKQTKIASNRKLIYLGKRNEG